MSGKNNNDNHQQSLADQPTAGHLLSKQRESLGLTPEKCAQNLKISVQKLKALEAGDYSVFTSDLFVRGYLKNYAKLVSLPECDVLGSYAAHMPDLQQEEVVALNQETTQNRWWLPYTIGILIVVLWVALYQILSPSDGSANPDDVLSIEEAVVIEVPIQNDLPPSQNQPIEAKSKLLVDDSSVFNEPENNVSTADDSSLLPSSGLKETVPIVVSNVTAAELIKSITPEPEEPPVEALPVDDTLFFSFSEDCWIRVTDSGGQVVVSGLQRGNTQLKLVGKAPFKVVLGNARGTTLALNDTPVALANQRTLRLTVGG